MGGFTIAGVATLLAVGPTTIVGGFTIAGVATLLAVGPTTIMGGFTVEGLATVFAVGATVFAVGPGLAATVFALGAIVLALGAIVFAVGPGLALGIARCDPRWAKHTPVSRPNIMPPTSSFLIPVCLRSKGRTEILRVDIATLGRGYLRKEISDGLT
jgi:hypothetical protein